MKVLVLTTSYPPEGGTFVADAVEHVRARGVQVDVVSPASFRHFGIAGRRGIIGNLRARPWLVMLVPVFLWNFRRAALSFREVDLVHAHWLIAGVVAATLGRPYVVQVWGTDVELARRLPRIFRFPHVIAASKFLADSAYAIGAHRVYVVPGGVEIPPPAPLGDRVLFVGRLSPEKGIEEFLAATEGLPRVVVGGGAIAVADSVGSVPHDEVGRYYDDAAIVVVPSRREGYGMAAREAMAHGRPVVASAVGGLVEAVDDGVDGILVPPRDVGALRTAIERLLADGDLCVRLGDAARAKAEAEWSWTATTDALVCVYEELLEEESAA